MLQQINKSADNSDNTYRKSRGVKIKMTKKINNLNHIDIIFILTDIFKKMIQNKYNVIL